MNWRVETYQLGSEAAVREEILHTCDRANAGEILIFPEYAAYTAEEAERTLDALLKKAQDRRLTIVTTLNLDGSLLPHSKPGHRYNALALVTPQGELHVPAAKTTPQSFEMVQYSERFPEINVTPYDYIRRVTLIQGDETRSCVFSICSDLYVLLFGGPDYNDLRADIGIFPGNFGRGAERAARRVIDRLRTAGVFAETIFSNPLQLTKKPDQLPAVLPARDHDTRTTPAVPLTDAERIKLFRENVLFYVDETVEHFVAMATLTPMHNGRFTMPMSLIDASPALEYADTPIDLNP
ncbi:MAG: hypothetical protein ACYCVB_18800 [Bacilli bacterium]